MEDTPRHEAVRPPDIQGKTFARSMCVLLAITAIVLVTLMFLFSRSVRTGHKSSLFPTICLSDAMAQVTAVAPDPRGSLLFPDKACDRLLGPGENPLDNMTLVFLQVRKPIPIQAAPYLDCAILTLIAALANQSTTYQHLSVLITTHADIINAMAKGAAVLEVDAFSESFWRDEEISVCDRFMLCDHLERQRHWLEGLNGPAFDKGL